MEKDLVDEFRAFFIRRIASKVSRFIELWKQDREYTWRLVERRRLRRKRRKLDCELRRVLQNHHVMSKFPFYWSMVWIIVIYIIYMLATIAHELNLFGTRSPLP